MVFDLTTCVLCNLKKWRSYCENFKKLTLNLKLDESIAMRPKNLKSRKFGGLNFVYVHMFGVGGGE